VSLSFPRSGVLAAALASATLAPAPAAAQVRRRFEPTDLDLTPAGTLELDTQFSYTEGPDAGRVITPDFEASLGLVQGVQLEVDGAYAVEGPPVGRFSFDHPAPDNLWISSKIGIADFRDEASGRAWAFGAQLGPKVPLSPGARGAGYEALGLVGRTVRRAHVVMNLGGFVDPGTDDARRRPVAIEGGFDVELDLDAEGVWSLTGELGGVAFLSGEDHQGHATGGVTWSATPSLDLSLVGLLGLFGGGDRAGVLLGVTPRFAIFP